ncbi:MAG: GspE/PulE family protein, partial [Akkermansiaceae bacterium]
MFSNEDYLADLLVEAGYITAVQLRDTRAALDANQTIIKYLLSAGTITEEQVSETLANNAGVPFVIIHQLNLDPSIITSIPDDVVRRFRAIPIADDGTFLTVAVSDPLNFETLDSLPHVTGREINFTCSTPTDIANHLRQFYNSEEEQTKDINNEFNVSTGDTEAGAETGDAPVIRLVQQTLTDAFRLKASDIHIEPLETSVRVRYRLDGKLVHVDSHPKKLLPAIIARLKVMSGTMSIAEKRLPQDGRIQLKMGDK